MMQRKVQNLRLAGQTGVTMSRKCLLDCSANGGKWADDVRRKNWNSTEIKHTISSPFWW